MKPLKPLAGVLAFVKGIQRGVDVFMQLDEARGRAGARRRGAEDDEHLFI